MICMIFCHCTTNINGLTSSKLEDPDFLNYICKYGIIFMYESWTHKKSDIKLNGYESFNFYRRFQNRRANRCSGGIVLSKIDENRCKQTLASLP